MKHCSAGQRCRDAFKKKAHTGKQQAFRVGFTHVGGGCMLVPRGRKGTLEKGPLDFKRGYPCDDEYESNATGRVTTVLTTPERHWDMPERVKSMQQVYRLKGVKRS